MPSWSPAFAVLEPSFAVSPAFAAEASCSIREQRNVSYFYCWSRIRGQRDVPCFCCWPQTARCSRMLGPSMAVACARFSEAHAEKPAAAACSNRRRPRFKLFKRVVQFEQIVKKRKDQVLLIRRGGPRPDGVRILTQRSMAT